MLDREWVSVVDPDDPHERYVFDVSFLLSSYTCIYGRGCPGVGDEPDPVRGCCRLGAHYTDDEDRERVEAMVERLGPDYLQFYRVAARDGVTATLPGGQARTRVRDGACVFANRGDWHRGPGCALHTYAVERGEHPMTYKPEVCWMVPLRREIAEDVGDDGQPVSITTITSFERGAWGPGGADFGWWCTESAEAFVGEDPVYRSMEAELRQMVGHAVYTELATYLDRRRSRARKPLPFPLYVR